MRRCFWLDQSAANEESLTDEMLLQKLKRDSGYYDGDK
jgi:hypothetical protein